HIYWGMHIEGVTYSCVFSYALNPGVYSAIDKYDVAGDRTPDGVPDILDEAMFGLEYLERLFLPNGTFLGSLVGTLQFVPPQDDTDGIIGNADDRQLFSAENHSFASPYEVMWVVAGFAKMASIIKQTGYFSSREGEMAQYATNIYNNYSRYFNFTDPSNPNSSANNPAIAALLAAWELYQYTSNLGYAENATTAATFIHDHYYSEAVRDELGDWNRVVGFYCYWALQNATVTARAMAQDVGLAKWKNTFVPMTNATDDYFGILQMPMDDLAHVGYFWNTIGLNSYYLTAAFAAFMTYNITNRAYPQILAFGLRQLDWLFGANPFGVCMVEGVGTYNPPIYHQRYAFIPGNPRGATPGAIVNGITEDNNGLPFINLNSAAGTYLQDHLSNAASNEPWLPHNVHFQYAMSALYACVLR
ncbi:MAG TPA: glycoside hydrolase family 9 protein, partial [Candidatus Lokiarchaeia archaeon]|nr:glycoside hydrolase family 9 protein [Candidatus Lokiarchaeia archaeon]